MLVFCLDQFPSSQNLLRHNTHYSLKCMIFMEIFICKFMLFITYVSFTFQMFSFSFFVSFYSVVSQEVEVKFMER